MPDQVPNFDNETIKKLVIEHYDIEGEICPLVSFEDQNALIKTSEANYVFKIANKRWSHEFLEMQTDVLGYLKNTAPELVFPSLVKTLNGQSIIYVDGFAIRLLTYLEGELYTHTEKSPELYQDIGRFLGQFSKAMANYSFDVKDGSDELWKLDNVMACKVYLPEVIDEDARDRIERLYVVYENKILPKLPLLRKAIIHGDANEQNLLVASDNTKVIAGLIDFGEIQLASQINDLAIALAYTLLGEDDIAMASAKIIEGYDAEFKLDELEREILYYLIAMRLVTNITMTSHLAKLFPENEYILFSQKPARAL
ncbi:MAG: Ser/Thr protein kinase RdoA (MazF antagonist), partial [Enterobacterales bacterium]